MTRKPDLTSLTLRKQAQFVPEDTPAEPFDYITHIAKERIISPLGHWQ